MSKKEKPKKGEAPAADAAVAEGAEGVDGAAPAKKGLPIKLIAIAAAALLVLGGGGGAAYMFLLKPKPAEAAGKPGEKHAEKGKEKEKKKEKKGGHGGGEKGEAEKTLGVIKEGPDGVVFYTMPGLMANMQSPDGRPGMIKLTVTFELADDIPVETLESNMPRLQDMFQTFMRELRPEDISGSQGSYTLRMEIQRRVNLLIAPAKVNAVLIESMLQT